MVVRFGFEVDFKFNFDFFYFEFFDFEFVKKLVVGLLLLNSIAFIARRRKGRVVGGLPSNTSALRLAASADKTSALK